MKPKQETQSNDGKLRAAARGLAQDLRRMLDEAEEQGAPPNALHHVARRDLERYHQITRQH